MNLIVVHHSLASLEHDRCRPHISFVNAKQMNLPLVLRRCKPEKERCKIKETTEEETMEMERKRCIWPAAHGMKHKSGPPTCNCDENVRRKFQEWCTLNWKLSKKRPEKRRSKIEMVICTFFFSFDKLTTIQLTSSLKLAFQCGFLRVRNAS